MKSRTWTSIISTILFASLAVPIRLAAQERQNKQQPHYKLIDLGTLGGPNSGVPTVFYEINGTAGARAITNQGTVAGTADTSMVDPICYLDDCFYPGAFQWQNGVLNNLGTLPGGQGSVVDWISGNGFITGNSENGATDPLSSLPEIHAVLWQRGQIVDLGALSGGFESSAWSVNNRGQVVGFSTNGTLDPYSYFYFQFFGSSTGTQVRAFLWDKQNGMQDLGTLGGPDAWAGLVNERGQVAGISYPNSTANAANGTCGANVPTQDPFFWEKDSGMIDIGTFGGTCGITNALNKRGQVAGQSYLAGNLTATPFFGRRTAIHSWQTWAAKPSSSRPSPSPIAPSAQRRSSFAQLPRASAFFGSEQLWIESSLLHLVCILPNALFGRLRSALERQRRAFGGRILSRMPRQTLASAVVMP
jgi:hypothetical protein